MAKTQRRRAARAAHDVEIAIAHSHRVEATPRLSQRDDDWHHLMETLDGLLRIEFPSLFTDVELLCPKEAWLVVDLARVRAPSAAAPSLQHQLGPVLDALARLLIHAETLRPWDDLYESYWRRVLAFEMLDHDQMNEALVRGFVRFVKAKGSHVALQWRGRGLDSSQVVGPVNKWLETTVDVAMSARCVPVQVALRFEDCQLTARHLTEIHHNLLQMTVQTAFGKPWLCEASTLRELSLSGNILHTDALHALAAIIEDPNTRRIDGLHLDSTVPSQDHQTPAYTAMFTRVVAAVMTAHAGDAKDAPDDSGVSLSLEDCVVYKADHVDALVTALTQATRPLRKLSLACWQFADLPALHRFGRLVLAPLPTATDAFDMNLSCISSVGSVDAVETVLAAARTDVLQALLAAGKIVTCRLARQAAVFGDDDEWIDMALSPTRYFRVRAVHASECCAIALPDETDDTHRVTDTVNVWLSDVAAIRIQDAQPCGVILDRCSREQRGHAMGTGLVTLFPIVLLCVPVARLATRYDPRRWYPFVSRCVALQELNCNDAWSSSPELWAHVLNAVGPSLLSLSVAACRFDAAMVRTVLALPSLQHLGFARNKIRGIRRDELIDLVRACDTLRYVDLRDVSVDAQHRDNGHSVTTLVHHARTGVETRHALLLTIRHVETALGLPQSLTQDVAACLFSFLDTNATCEFIF